jgi:hypothetical protein
MSKGGQSHKGGWVTTTTNGGGNTYNAGCFKTHKPLPIQHEGVDYHIYGTSATRDFPPDTCHIFIGLDQGMKRTWRRFPWHVGYHEFMLPIQDMGVPPSKDIFDALLGWLKTELLENKTIYLGCIGGHGRTGFVLAAFVNLMMPEIQNPIKYVRDNYCHKAVESQVQIDYLVKHHGAEKDAKPTKGPPVQRNVGGTWSQYGSSTGRAPGKTGGGAHDTSHWVGKGTKAHVKDHGDAEAGKFIATSPDTNLCVFTPRTSHVPKATPETPPTLPLVAEPPVEKTTQAPGFVNVVALMDADSNA